MCRESTEISLPHCLTGEFSLYVDLICPLHHFVVRAYAGANAPHTLSRWSARVVRTGDISDTMMWLFLLEIQRGFGAEPVDPVGIALTMSTSPQALRWRRSIDPIW